MSLIRRNKAHIFWKGFFMQVTNNNVSFKAHFTPNAQFKTLYGNARPNSITKEIIANLKKLPDHELEIINTAKIKLPDGGYGTDYTIFNNFTNKTINKPVSHLDSALVDIIQYLNSPYVADFFRETPLHTQNYLALTMPKIFK